MLMSVLLRWAKTKGYRGSYLLRRAEAKLEMCYLLYSMLHNSDDNTVN